MSAMEQQTSPRAVFTVEEVAEYLGIGRSKAYELVSHRPGFPAVRLGKSIRVPRHALDRWLEEQIGHEGPGF